MSFGSATVGSAMTRRIALMATTVLLGVLGGLIFPQATGLLGGQSYTLSVTALLAVGLYGSTHGIDIGHLRSDVHTVVLAVTVGVLLKAALITAVLLAAFHNPAYLVLGIAVAQIDPLSVAALGESSRLSRRGKALLLAWASFDDPVTTLLTIYIAALALPLQSGATAVHPTLGDPAMFTLDLACNLGVAAIAIWLYRLTGRFAPRWLFPVGAAILAVVFAVGVWQTWMLAVALVGLQVRPQIPERPEAVQRMLDRAINAAFLLAALLLGVVLSAGISPIPGLVLGVTAFVAHALVSLPLTRSQARTDRVLLALAQQNGITAIILALLLEPFFGGTVAVVAPAILVINMLYLLSNAVFTSGARRRTRDARPGA
ncbi:hypothetical protein [Actinomadura luteofluorescens]|uniref:hypothetical protein n=1 Tax=Actinomadura luteofluorescens TaxID=46163 RepID=UPI003D91B929